MRPHHARGRPPRRRVNPAERRRCSGGARCLDRSPAAARPARPLAVRAACCCLWRRWCSGRRRARPPARSPHASFARSGRSRSPPVPSGPSGALHTSGAWPLLSGLALRLEVRPGPAGLAAASNRSGCLCVAPPGPDAAAISHAIPSNVFHGLKSDRWNSAESTLVWGRAELELHAKLMGLVSAMVLVPQGHCTTWTGIALLRQALHCLVASAMLCYLVHWSCI